MSFDIAITKSIGEHRVEVAIDTDEPIVALVGPSGIGKTTLLNCIAGLSRPDRGHIRIRGLALFDSAASIDLPPERRGCGYVFQDCRLFPHLNVKRNLVYGLRGESGRSSPLPFEDIVERLDLAGLLERRTRNLSGGETRRVAIGRAVLARPGFLLLDEPLSSLDPERASQVRAVIEQLTEDCGVPAIIVSHHRDDVARLARRVVELPNRR